MIPKNKAGELVEKFKFYAYSNTNSKHFEELLLHNAKQCALIAVDEILNLNLGLSNCDENNWEVDKFYTEVKKEINKL